MISILHLLWIVPMAVIAGAFCMALLAVNNKNNIIYGQEEDNS